MKTVTMRLDEETFQIIKIAAEGERRNLSNFIEFAVLQYLSSVRYVDRAEMTEILNDEDLVKNLRKGLEDVDEGDISIV